ncbi:hypothetical protein K458DRAFT_468444 [Lentithecium fluviatile CBS 122367]|uniref:Uncharacterized protein n=1 Tax=Lentithecium fluviatile CBS 122367 TaxID=1168545 RepID=A0A6G1IE76_9PLEO|nr:hypothetical protein K458DRAFT_468444 [Lentithecium fluviatile CBS 122367]
MTSPLCLLVIAGYLMLLISPLTRSLARDFLGLLNHIVTNLLQLVWREARLMRERDEAVMAHNDMVEDKVRLEASEVQLRNDNQQMQKVLHTTWNQLMLYQQLGRHAPVYQEKAVLLCQIKGLKEDAKDYREQLAVNHDFENQIIRLQQALAQKSAEKSDALRDAKEAWTREVKLCCLHPPTSYEVLHQHAETTDPECLSVAVLFAKAVQLAGVNLVNASIDLRRFDLLCQFVSAGMGPGLSIQPQGYGHPAVLIDQSRTFRDSGLGASFGGSQTNVGSIQQKQITNTASTSSLFTSVDVDSNTKRALPTRLGWHTSLRWLSRKLLNPPIPLQQTTTSSPTAPTTSNNDNSFMNASKISPTGASNVSATTTPNDNPFMKVVNPTNTTNASTFGSNSNTTAESGFSIKGATAAVPKNKANPTPFTGPLLIKPVTDSPLTTTTLTAPIKADPFSRPFTSDSNPTSTTTKNNGGFARASPLATLNSNAHNNAPNNGSFGTSTSLNKQNDNPFMKAAKPPSNTTANTPIGFIMTGFATQDAAENSGRSPFATVGNDCVAGNGGFGSAPAGMNAAKAPFNTNGPIGFKMNAAKPPSNANGPIGFTMNASMLLRPPPTLIDPLASRWRDLLARVRLMQMGALDLGLGLALGLVLVLVAVVVVGLECGC